MRKKRGFWKFIWAASRKAWAWMTSAGAFIFSFIFFAFTSTNTAPILPVLIWTAIMIWASVTCAITSIEIYSAYAEAIEEEPLPRIESAERWQSSLSNEIWCVASSNRLFKARNLVSVYHVDNHYERRIAIGYVLVVQDNGLIQIVLTQQVVGSGQFIQQLSNGSKDMLESCIIRPFTIPDERLQPL